MSNLIKTLVRTSLRANLGLGARDLGSGDAECLVVDFPQLIRGIMRIERMEKKEKVKAK